MKIPVYRYESASNKDHHWIYTLSDELAGKGKLPQVGIFTLNEDIVTAEIVRALGGEMLLLLRKGDRLITADELVDDGEQMGLGVYTQLVNVG